MRILREITTTLIASTLLITSVYCGDEEVKKKISKEFQADENTHLIIENKFGAVDINDWEKDEISLLITITVEHPNEEKAKEILEYLDVKIIKEGNTIKAQTVIDDKLKDKGFDNDRKDFSIDYTVHVPKYLHLSLLNKYGDIFINELDGLVDIELRYGNMKVNKLSRGDEKPMNKIELAYSKATVEESGWLKVNMKYSGIKMMNSQALILLSKYSQLTIEKTSSIVLEGKYDNYKFGEVTNFVGTTQYSNIKIGTTVKKFICESKYSDTKIEYMPEDFKVIKIDSKYGKTRIGIDPGASYKLNGEAHYGKIYCPEEGRMSKVEQPHSYTIFGLVGTNEETNSQVEVKSSYGHVYLIE